MYHSQKSSRKENYMKSAQNVPKLFVVFALAAVLGCGQVVAQQTTAFTYQGQLRDGGTNANGAYTMIFKLYDAVTNGNQLAGSITNSVTLGNGLFSVSLDFGSNTFDGNRRWLEIKVEGDTLAPRVGITPVPYALFAAKAGSLTQNGTIAAGTISATKVILA